MQQATLAITRIPLDVLRDVTVALHARRLGDMRMIRAQDRQALYLKALGFRYHEIAALLGITYTAVNRRITEGRRRLRELEAAHDVVSGHSRTSRPRCTHRAEIRPGAGARARRNSSSSSPPSR